MYHDRSGTTTLTVHHQELITASYRRLEPLLEETMDLFFSRLFEIAPYIRPVFKGDIRPSSAALLAMFRMTMEHLDRPEVLATSFERAGKLQQERGFTSGYYDIFASAFLWTLERMLPGNFTEEVRSAWIALYVEIARSMKKGAAGLGRAA